MHFGPCDETGKNAAAGVGVIWKDEGVKVFPEQTGDADLRKASEAGRVGK